MRMSRDHSPDIVTGRNESPLESPNAAHYSHTCITSKSPRETSATHSLGTPPPMTRTSYQAPRGAATPAERDVTSANGGAGPTVPHLRMSASLARSSSATTAASAVGVAASPTRVSANSQLRSSVTPAARPPTVPSLNSTMLHPADTSISSRPTGRTAMSSARGSATGQIRGTPKLPRPVVATAAPDYTAYPPDVAKVLKEIIRRRNEGAMLRVLPKCQQLEQLLLQEQTAREQAMMQESIARMQIENRKREETAKRQEQELARISKVKMDDMKAHHQGELADQKAMVAANLKETEAEVKDRLKLLTALQPKLNIAATVIAQLKDENNDCSLYGELLMEDKQLQKSLKTNARYNKSKTAETDGGALPYWWKDCLCASFNVAAIMQRATARACVQDATFSTKVPGDKKLIVVKDASVQSAPVVAWGHARSGPTPVALAEAYVTAKPAVPELPAAAYSGVVWPRDEAVEVIRSAKAAKSPISEIVGEVQTTISYGGVSSYELMRKDVLAIGEATST